MNESPPLSEVQPARRRRFAVWVALAVALGAAFAIGGAARLATRGVVYVEATVDNGGAVAPADADARRQKALRRLAALAPRGVYVVVDTYGGRLRVYRGEELLREAVSSAGSGSALRDPRDGRLWVFETPLGLRRVQRKVTDPVWNKPDWAFVEEGVTPPPTGHPDRRDTISLGDYALYLGDGYIIHGTLFQSTLGRRITHGCIRLGDDDLEWVYANVPLGAQVWLF